MKVFRKKRSMGIYGTLGTALGVQQGWSAGSKQQVRLVK